MKLDDLTIPHINDTMDEDWIKDKEFYDNPNHELNDKMDEVEAMLRQQANRIKELESQLKLDGCIA
jgi:hypothetical protein